MEFALKNLNREYTCYTRYMHEQKLRSYPERSMLKFGMPKFVFYTPFLGPIDSDARKRTRFADP